MPRPTDPNSRTTPVTIKVTRAEAKFLKNFGGTPGKGLRRVLAHHINSGHYMLWSEEPEEA